MALVTVPPYTVEALDRFPEDGNRYEMLHGVLLVTPFPAPVHQIAAGRISARPSSGVGPAAHAVSSGVISVPPRPQLQPDIVVHPSRA